MRELESLFGPPFNQKLIQELQETFPPLTIEPGTDMTNIMFDAGQQSIISYLINRLEQET
tara:strand:- start:8005 stop:8184 length:180 start_codon:yes stop_codon:yes gene_type:complete